MVSVANLAIGQCATQWLPGHGAPGVHGRVNAAVVWDEDGVGSLPPRLIVGGQFDSAGTVQARNLAAFDLQNGTWSELGGGADQPVHALAVDGTGGLVVGGVFSQLGGSATGAIARWSGTAWQMLGTGIAWGVYSLAVLPNGDLVAGGNFASAGGLVCTNLARWDGTTWSPLGSGCDNAVLDLQVMPSGDLVATGYFRHAGGIAANRIARWNGTSWSALGSGLTGYVLMGLELSAGNTLALDPQGQLLVGGQFFAAGGVAASHLARWNGSNWQAMGWSLGIVNELAVRPNGEAWVAGDFPGRLRRSAGATWSITGIGFDEASTLSAFVELPSGELCVGGGFDRAGGAMANGVARWDGAHWSAFTPGIVGTLWCAARRANGDVVVGGDILGMPGVATNRVALWNGSIWSNMGSGINGTTRALLAMPDGSMIAGASALSGSGPATGTPARWTGTAWQTLGGGAIGAVLALCRASNGDIIAGGLFQSIGGVPATGLARWDGSSWHAFAPPLSYGGNAPRVHALATLPNGDLIVGGLFTHAGAMQVSHVARWDGSQWHAYPPLTTGHVQCVEPLRDGTFAIGGDFTLGSIRRAARWNGSAWQALGPTVAYDAAVHAIAELPNGDLIVGGEPWVVNGQQTRAMRTDGSSWSVPAGGVLGSSAFATVNDFLWSDAGELLVVGGFEQVGTSISRSLARLATPCPTAIAASPTPCLGPAGPLSLSAVTQPWSGAPFASMCTGFAPGAIAASVFSFQPLNLSLAAVHPAGLAGCTLVADPEVVVLSLPANGVATGQCRFANSPVWAGTRVHHQFVQGTFDASFALLTLSTSNALTLTIGSF